MADRDWLAERFEAHRPHLRAVAYRMLGSLVEAEDAVQDAWLRASRADAAEVDNLGGWLTTIVARLCLDRLRTRASRREDLVGVQLPDPIVTTLDEAGTTAARGEGDPERLALLADSIGLALLIVLDRLPPAERLAFVLHDTFGLPFDQIAPIVDRTPVATRQLASRARRRVRGARAPATDVPLERQREIVAAFVAASAAGDFEALLRVLDPDVVVRGDTGPGSALPQGPAEVRGAEAVAAQAMRFASLAPGARQAVVNGTIGGVVFTNGRPYAVIAFTFRGDRILELDIITRRDRLARLDLARFA